jgi:hypothetical protein
MESICQIRIPPHIFDVLRENKDLIDDHFLMSETVERLKSGGTTTEPLNRSATAEGLNLRKPHHEATQSLVLGSAGGRAASSMGSQALG